MINIRKELIDEKSYRDQKKFISDNIKFNDKCFQGNYFSNYLLNQNIKFYGDDLHLLKKSYSSINLLEQYMEYYKIDYQEIIIFINHLIKMIIDNNHINNEQIKNFNQSYANLLTGTNKTRKSKLSFFYRILSSYVKNVPNGEKIPEVAIRKTTEIINKPISDFINNLGPETSSDEIIDFIGLKMDLSEIPNYDKIKISIYSIIKSQFCDMVMINKIFETLNELTYFEINNTVISIFHKESDNNYVFNLIKHINNIIKLFSNKITKLGYFNFYLLEDEKILPEKNQIIGRINVNSGENTEFGINVFRKEECLKVFIHELYHFCDFNISNFTLTKLTSNTKINNIPNEAVIELFAVITWNEYLSKYQKYYENKNKIIKEDMFYINLYCKLIFYDLCNNLQNCNKLLNNFGLSNLSEILIQNNYSENTAAICYYLIKSVLLLNYHNIMIQYSVNKENFVSFINNIIEQIFDNSSVINQLVKISTNNINNVLRMSISEINL